MQECPRCGFSQPKDRFCANCGLDIDNFHPEPQSLKDKILSNTLFQVSAVIVTIGALVFILYLKQSDDIEQLNFSPQPEDVETISEKEQDPPIKKAAAPKEDPKPSPKTDKPATQQKADQLVATPKKDEKVAVSAATSTIPNRIIFEYAELPQSALQRVADTGNLIGSDGPVSAILIKHDGTITDWVKSLGGLLLSGRSQANLVAETPLSSKFQRQQSESVGRAESDVEQVRPAPGYSYEVHLFATSIQATSVELDIATRLAFPNSDLGEVQASLSAQDKPGHILVLVGTIPFLDGASLPGIEVRNSPLEIFYSATYAERNSDLVVIIDAK